MQHKRCAGYAPGAVQSGSTTNINPHTIHTARRPRSTRPTPQTRGTPGRSQPRTHWCASPPAPRHTRQGQRPLLQPLRRGQHVVRPWASARAQPATLQLAPACATRARAPAVRAEPGTSAAAGQTSFGWQSRPPVPLAAAAAAAALAAAAAAIYLSTRSPTLTTRSTLCEKAAGRRGSRKRQRRPDPVKPCQEASAPPEHRAPASSCVRRPVGASLAHERLAAAAGSPCTAAAGSRRRRRCHVSPPASSRRCKRRWPPRAGPGRSCQARQPPRWLPTCTRKNSPPATSCLGGSPSLSTPQMTIVSSWGSVTPTMRSS
jgi:hypothetical protein